MRWRGGLLAGVAAAVVVMAGLLLAMIGWTAALACYVAGTLALAVMLLMLARRP